MRNRLVRELAIAADHPAFAGHFPGRPLLPGALLLAEVVEAARLEPAPAARLAAGATLTSAKFLAPVGPGARLSLALEWDESGMMFEASEDGRAVARGQWRWAAAQ
jgi:3-hydroxymyristoyl/3-hydroxydecanoyl-(acyl carrier protein) dehydratase